MGTHFSRARPCFVAQSEAVICVRPVLRISTTLPFAHPEIRDEGAGEKAMLPKVSAAAIGPVASQRVLGMSFRKARARSGTATRWT